MIHIAKPSLGEEECAAVVEAIKSGWVTQGPRVAAFEEAFCRQTGAKYACAVSSCTTALHLALLSVGVQPGDVVITVSHSFIATANAIRVCNAEPVFVDIEPQNGNMAPQELASCIAKDFSPRSGGDLFYRHVPRLQRAATSPLNYIREPLGRLGAILVVHQAGMPADLQNILLLAHRYNIPLVEDAACAIGSQIFLDDRWQHIGLPHGDIACFSFHPRKLVTTGDGGMLTVKDTAHDVRLRLLRQHGMTVSDTARHTSNKVIFEQYSEAAYNYRLTDIQAAMGLEQLNRLPKLIQRRRELAEQYIQELRNVSAIATPEEPTSNRSNWQTFLITLKEPANQLPLMEFLLAQGIATRRGIMCAHREVPYKDAWHDEQLPHSCRAQDGRIALPLHDALDEKVISAICRHIQDFFAC